MRFSNEMDSRAVPQWLRVIHEVNRFHPGTFGKPTWTGPWWAGGSVEEHDTARVINHDDDTTTVEGKTASVAMWISMAADRAGIAWLEETKVLTVQPRALDSAASMRLGFREIWVNGDTTEKTTTGEATSFTLKTGGSSSHLILTVMLPGGEQVTQAIDVTELVKEWINQIVD